MMLFFPLVFALTATVVPAGAAPAACVENGTGEPLYFTVQSRTGGARIGATLPPGAELCLSEAHPAIFTAFASATSVAGCPRLSGADGRDTLLHFLPTDSCRWASHGQ